MKAENLSDFWNIRAAFIESVYGEVKGKYFQTVAAKLQKLEYVAPDAEVNLWFEHELFCQTNMWFCLSLLQESKPSIYRVASIVESENDVWKGFGNNNAKTLQRSYDQKIKFEEKDVALGANLWRAFQNSDAAELEDFHKQNPPVFRISKQSVAPPLKGILDRKRFYEKFPPKAFPNSAKFSPNFRGVAEFTVSATHKSNDFYSKFNLIFREPSSIRQNYSFLEESSLCDRNREAN